MIIEKTGTGATAEEAAAAARAQLNAPDDVIPHTEIIQQPKKKLFGLKTEPAIVRVWYEAPDALPAKPAPKAEAPAPAPKKEPREDRAPAKPEQPAPAKKPEARPAPKPEQTEKAENPAAQPQPAPQPKQRPAAAEKPAAEEPAVTRVPVALAEDDRTAAYIRMIAAGMGIETCEISLEKIEETEEYVYTVACGKEDGVLIGKRGETLDALQYLVRLCENKGLEEAKHRKISVNVGNYREKRNASLRTMAQNTAKRVLKTGRNIAMDPMPPYERRIVHTVIQTIPGVTSHSVGSDASRKVVVTLEEGVQPTNPRSGYGRGGRGGYGGGRDRDRGGRRDRSGFQKREPYQPAVTREPRKDAEGSLYGKIEIPPKHEEETE